MREHAALEVGTDLALDEAGDGHAVPTRTRQQGLELVAHDFVKERLLGLVAFVLDGKGPSGPEPNGEAKDQKAACWKAFRRVVNWRARDRGPAIERLRPLSERISRKFSKLQDDLDLIGATPENGAAPIPQPFRGHKWSRRSDSNGRPAHYE